MIRFFKIHNVTKQKSKRESEINILAREKNSVYLNSGGGGSNI